jgi:SulP family sulfate permease
MAFDAVWSVAGHHHQTKDSDVNDELAGFLLKEADDLLYGGSSSRLSESELQIHKVSSAPRNLCVAALARLPGLIIGAVMNVMLCVPFGLAFFPASWEPFPVPRAVGLQMFLFSTFVGQLVMTAGSDFDCALGMMMVENVPFMHNLAQSIIDQMGKGSDALATVMVSFALSTLCVGAAFMYLGHNRLGNVVNYFPRHFIIGCIGGIGIFVTQTGFEVSTGGHWQWNLASAESWTQPGMVQLWAVVILLVIILNISICLCPRPLLPPIFFVSIIPCFYLVMMSLGVSLEEAREQNWVFTRPPATDFWLIWTFFDLRLVRWDLVLSSVPTMIALTCFGLMHAPINVPSLSMSTGIEADMNRELVVHGYSNLISGIFGGLPNYLVYSNSLLYFKCHGGGRTSGFLLSAFLAAAFAAGPSMIAYVPRCMAGTLLVHVGLDLCRESLVEPFTLFDTFEYVCVLIIAITMTVLGMTAGLGIGLVLSAISFTLQQMSHSEPVRGIMPATTLRSTIRRSLAEQDVLAHSLRSVKVMQLQGTIFFGNATDLLSQCAQVLAECEPQTRILILDFTLVRSLESSASETVAKIYPLVKSYGASLVYNRGRTDGFPTAAPLSTRLNKLNNDGAKGRGPSLHIADDLDGALAWAEDQLLGNARLEGSLPQTVCGPSNQEHCNHPLHVRQMHTLCEGEDLTVAMRILDRMERCELCAGTVLWKQGAPSDHCLLLSEGLLQSELEEEAGTTEECQPGCLIGEYAFLNKQRRMSTLRAKQRSVVYILRRKQFEELLRADPYLCYVISCISIRYLGHRCHHVANRIWDTRCLSI